MEAERYHLQFIVGPTCSEKTVMVRKFLENYKKLFANINNKVKVLWCHVQWQEMCAIPLKSEV